MVKWILSMDTANPQALPAPPSLMKSFSVDIISDCHRPGIVVRAQNFAADTPDAMDQSGECYLFGATLARCYRTI
jgi:hypothetical protein